MDYACQNLFLTIYKILDKGKELLIALRGASFPKGTIASQFNFINSAELGDLTKINGNSSAMDLHKAILKLKNVMIDASRVLPEKHPDTGEDYMAAFRSLQMNLILLKLEPAQRMNIMKGFDSVMLSNLSAAYQQQSNSFLRSEDTTRQMQDLQREELHYMDLLSNNFMTLLHEFTGTDPKVFVASLGKANSDLIAQIKSDAISEANREAKTRLENHYQDYMKGEHFGFLRDKFENIAYNKSIAAKRPFNTSEMFSAAVFKDVKRMLDWNIISSMISFSNGRIEDTSFFKDLSVLDVKIEDKPLNKDPKIALDQLAQFVTQGKKSAFDGLTAEEKNKVGIVMSMISKQTVKTITDGVPLGLSDNHDKPLFKLSGNGPQSEKSSLNLRYSGDSFVVNCSYEQDASSLQYGGQDITLNPNTKVKGNFEFRIDESELSRLGKFDYKSLNNARVQNIDEEVGPENQGDNAHDKMKRIMDTFSKDFESNIRMTESTYSIVEPD